MEYITAFSIGILSSSHCLGMCGGVVTFLSMDTNLNSNLYNNFFYNFGRIFSYALMAILINFIGSFLIDITGFYTIFFFKLISNLVLIIIGFHISNLFLGIFYLEIIFFKFFRFFTFFVRKVQKIKSVFSPFIIGILWGQVPCGLTYSTLIWTIGFASVTKSVLLMIFFGLGTLPSMLIFSYLPSAFSSLLNHKNFKFFFGCFIVVFGIYNIIDLFLNKNCH